MQRYTNRNILKITLPVLVSLLMEQLVGLTDTIYLGHYGDGRTELAASALAGVFYLVVFMLGFGFSVGAQVLIARRNGEGRLHEIGPVFMQGSLFLLLLAALLFALSRLCAEGLFSLLVEQQAVRRAAVDYLDWRVWGFFFSFAAAMFRALYVGTTRTRILTANSVVMVLTNVVLNYLLIFGRCGLPELGIAGAAIASVAAEAVSVLFFLLYTRLRFDWRRYRLFRFGGVDLRLLGHILSISVWVMLQEGMAFLSWFLFFVCIERLGTDQLAVTNMVRSIGSVVFLFVNAFASTASSLVSNLIGAGHTEEVRPLCRRMTRLCFSFVVPLALLIALFPERVLGFYSDDARLVAYGPLALGDALDLRALRAGLHRAVRRLGNGPHARDAGHRPGGHPLLYGLYALAHARAARRRGALLDHRPPLLSGHAAALGALPAQRPLAAGHRVALRAAAKVGRAAERSCGPKEAGGRSGERQGVG